MIQLTEEEYRKAWQESTNKATVSIRVFTPEGKEGYADLTRQMYFGELEVREFVRALKTFLPQMFGKVL